MKILYQILLILMASCHTSAKKIEVDISRHFGLDSLENIGPFNVLYSTGHLEQADKTFRFYPVKDKAYLFKGICFCRSKHKPQITYFSR